MHQLPLRHSCTLFHPTALQFTPHNRPATQISISLSIYSQTLFLTSRSFTMQDHLQFIEQFANTISATFRQFAQLCRTHLKKAKDNRPEFTELQTQLIKERKLRMELEEKIKARLSGEDKGERQSLDRGGQKEKRRPKNPFMLFVADQRDKILKDHPSLDFYRITSLAAIKWKKLNQETRQVYERRFEEINKLYAEEQSQPKERETVMVKREYTQEEEHEREGEDSQIRQREEERMEEEREQEGESREQRNDMAGTVMLEEEYAPTQIMPQPQKDTIENILDLFHTQQQPEMPEEIQGPPAQQIQTEAASSYKEQEKQSPIEEAQPNHQFEEVKTNNAQLAESPQKSEHSPIKLSLPREPIQPQE